MSMPRCSASVTIGATWRSANPWQALEQALANARADEHPEPAPLLQDALVDQDVQALGGGGRVDPIERGQLFARRHPVTIMQLAFGDLRGQLVGDLHEDRRPFIKHSLPQGGCSRQPVHY